MDYLQRQQQYNVQYFTQLRYNMNQAATEQGADIPSAASINVTNFMHVVTGTATIQTIIPPPNFAGQLMLISQDGFSLATGGNISLFNSPNFLAGGAHILLTWVPSKGIWFADTCRLSNSATGLSYAGHRVETE
jgi:hypothetical protein